MSCKENFFGLVVEMMACPVEYVNVTKEMMQEKKYVYASEYTLGTDGQTFLVPMENKSATCTEEQSDNLPGTMYEVSVTWTKRNPRKEDFDKLKKLKDKCNHLIIKVFGNNEVQGYFVFSDKDGYIFTYNESEGVLKCKLSVQNKNGLQRILMQEDDTDEGNGEDQADNGTA